MITRDPILTAPALPLVQEPVEMSAKQWMDLAIRLERATRICPYITSFQVSASLARSMASVTEAAAIYKRNNKKG
jgi:hypothetical protein